LKDKPDTPAELKARALRHLVRREHSRAELVRKLTPHAESEAALNAVVDLLLSKKQLSDERFAEERARSLSRKYGAAKIRQDLKERGVADEIVERVPVEGELERFLQGRGFSYDSIRGALALSGSTKFSDE
jgi:regulatory protein